MITQNELRIAALRMTMRIDGNCKLDSELFRWNYNFMCLLVKAFNNSTEKRLLIIGEFVLFSILRSGSDFIGGKSSSGSRFCCSGGQKSGDSFCETRAPFSSAPR
nr:PREDICTED: uncharacterized protein LOC105662747 [Megachile rotundata]